MNLIKLGNQYSKIFLYIKSKNIFENQRTTKNSIKSNQYQKFMKFSCQNNKEGWMHSNSTPVGGKHPIFSIIFAFVHPLFKQDHFGGFCRNIKTCSQTKKKKLIPLHFFFSTLMFNVFFGFYRQSFITRQNGIQSSCFIAIYHPPQTFTFITRTLYLKQHPHPHSTL